uniref:Outer dense fiber protein 3 n=2 Tax=Cacopsylla melanoneura TaxID=428564 RepID=A0A8D9F3M9_9HEMI
MGGLTQRPWTPTKRRGPIAAEFSGPGPACVTLPTTFGHSPSDSKKGRSPSYSFGSRHGGKNDSIGPGPGQYNVTGLSAKGKDSPPAASLHSRAKEHKSDSMPAPGDYNPEKSEHSLSNHDNAPKFTFGLKTQPAKPVNTPAPGDYHSDKVSLNFLSNHTQLPSYSFRQKIVLEKRSNTPAPGDYQPKNEKASMEATSNHASSSAFTFGPKIVIEIHSDTPAPNVYCPENSTIEFLVEK